MVELGVYKTFNGGETCVTHWEFLRAFHDIEDARAHADRAAEDHPFVRVMDRGETASPSIPKKTVALVIERDGGLCVLGISPDCLGGATCVDHRANRGSGGAGQRLNKPSCLVAACGPCNGAKADGVQRDELIRRGVTVFPDSTHEKTALRCLATPVEYPDGSLWWLRDDGTKSGQPW